MIWVLALLLVAMAAWALRLWGLSENSLSHPEIFVPGVPLPPGISAPPAHVSWSEALWFHYHDEPHPMGWYLIMKAWTAVAGTSEWALRFPSTVFGMLSVPLIYALGRRLWGPGVGLLAAVLLALHGYHIHLSQTARMYVPGALWALLLTVILLDLARSRERRPGLELGYVAVAFAGSETTELFWAVLVMQVVWAALVLPGAAPARTPRLLWVQAMALMAAAPALTHSLYRARHLPGGGPSWEFLREYLGFGFLFAHDSRAVPPIGTGFGVAVVLAVAGLALALSGLRGRAGRGSDPVPSADAPATWAAPAVALVAAAAMAWLALIATRRNMYLLVLAVLPLLALAVPALAVFKRRQIVGRIGPVDRWLRSADREVMLIAILGLVAPLLVLLASFRASVAAPRAFLVFVPFLILLVAAGAFGLVRGRTGQAVAAAVLTVIFALSVPFNAQRPQAPNDYKGLAQAIRAEMQPDDLIFVRKRNWVDTPFFYYMGDTHLVAEDYAKALGGGPHRVWLITWSPGAGEDAAADDAATPEDNAMPADDRRAALAGLTPARTLTARRAQADLFLSPGPGTAP